jgi:organic radical activating enzyme
MIELINEPLPVMEHFYTIQGEGAFSGQAAYFIRLGGCDVGCVWCDVKDSWDAGAHQKYPVNEIISWTNTYPAKIAVITGGEPLMYNLESLTKELKNIGFRTHVETSGAYELSGDFDWICLSPKKFKEPLPAVVSMASELKVIVYNKSDFDWAETYANQVPRNCLLYLQPEWDRRELMMPLITEYVKNNPKWRISLQVHKYLNIP